MYVAVVVVVVVVVVAVVAAVVEPVVVVVVVVAAVDVTVTVVMFAVFESDVAIATFLSVAPKQRSSAMLSVPGAQEPRPGRWKRQSAWPVSREALDMLTVTVLQ